MITELARILIESLTSQPNTAENKEQLQKLLVQLRQRYPKIFSEASLDAINKSDGDCRPHIEELILSLSSVSAVTAPLEYLLMTPGVDKPRLYTIHWGRGKFFWSYDRICGLGSEHTRSGGTGFIRRGE